MNWSSLTLQHLRYVDAVARQGQFGDAAADLDVSQPALSQGLARLEAIVGAELFEADGRRRVLTSAGRSVAEYAARTLADARDVAAHIDARRRGKVGPLSVGMIDAAALYLLSEQLVQYRAAHPEVELHLTIDTSSRLLQQLASGGLDVAIVVAPAPGFDTREILTEDLHVYGQQKADVTDLEQWVLYPASSHTRASIDSAFAELDFRPTVEAESGNPAVLAQLAGLGVGATVLPTGIVQSRPLPLVLIRRRFAIRSLIAARRRGTAPDSLADSFLETLATK